MRVEFFSQHNVVNQIEWKKLIKRKKYKIT